MDKKEHYYISKNKSNTIKSIATSTIKSNFCSAFTFAELMISLVIIAVITAILYPTISEIAPNNNKQLFKSAYKTIEMVVQDIIATSDDGNMPTTPLNVCNAFKERLNTVSFVDVESAASNDGCQSNIARLQTSNGMRWNFSVDVATKTTSIVVDVNAANNNVTSNPDSATPDDPGDPSAGEQITPTAATYWPNGSFRLPNSTARDTFLITVTQTGKISVKDAIGRNHLQDQEDD